MARLLVVDDKEIMRDSLHDTLCRVGHDVRCCKSGKDALSAFEKEDYEAVITDLKMPGMTGIEFLKEAKKVKCEIPVIVITAFSAVDTAVEAMRSGAFDYVKKPFSADDIEEVVERAVEQLALTMETTEGGSGAREIIGGSTAMRELRERIGRFARRNSTVLIVGETGTGKELVARGLHYKGVRRSRPFVCVNCAAMTESLFESELFGYEKGSFTGADAQRSGRFELAEDGTVFLDEISEIEPKFQASLLRVLQERVYERVGGSESLYVNARIVATTNRDLLTEVEEGRFRRDLYFRLNVIPLRVPPLREHKEDIPAVVAEFARRCGREGLVVPDRTIQKLMAHDWPGNVRQLGNVVERALEENDGEILEPEDVNVETWVVKSEEKQGLRSIEDVERDAIRTALVHFEGHQERSAASLGITSRTLRTKKRKYGL